jgi:hypothetical protein
MHALLVTVVVAFGLAVMPLQSQVPIDLSQAREFKVVWKKVIGGEAGAPSYLVAPCGAVGYDILSIPTSTTGAQYFTRPRLDTVQQVIGWGNPFYTFDYDGVEPTEYMNDNGRVDRCLGSSYPFSKQRGIDTISCWAGTINGTYTEDIDGDGYRDLICDIGGGGYTARVIRGGPQAGRGCQRILQIPRPPGRDWQNSTFAFWLSAKGVWRLLQHERDSNALSPWLVLYEMRLERTTEGTRITWIKTDSLYGNGNHLQDEPIGDAAVVVDTASRTDWLMAMRRLNNGPRTWVLERFDATDGRFTPTGEQVTGVDFLDAWKINYAMGTAKPTIGFHVSNVGQAICFADDLRKPFALIRGNDRDVVATNGFVFINDQTGDDMPDLVLSGGTPIGMVILMSMDSTLTSTSTEDATLQPAEVQMDDLTLVFTVDRPMTASVGLATTDGRHFQIVAPWQTSTGTQRIDLGRHVEDLPRGVYFVRVTLDAAVHTLQFVRP